MADDYAIVPEREVLKMKKSIENLQQDPFSASTEGRELISSIKELTRAVNNLNEIFEKAVEEIKVEDKSSESFAKQISTIFDKLDDVLEQNKKIAKGVVAVADMVEEKRQPQPAPRPQAPMMQMPQQPIMPRPLPPQTPPKKKGLFR